MRKILLLSSFFTIAPLIFLISMLYCLSFSFAKNSGFLTRLSLHPTKSIEYAALPATTDTMKTQIIISDARPDMIKQFLHTYQSPLEPYADKIVEEADLYHIDFRLLPAIAMQESNLCKVIPSGSYNCWGFGIYGHTVTKFSGFNEAIETVTRTLANKYKSNGLETPDQIMKRYTPSSNGSWAYSVNHFMNTLQ